MLRVEEALEQVLAAVSPLEAEEKPLLTALGQVLAEDVVSRLDVPPWDNSAMDGYAVRAEDASSATLKRPVTLPVAGEVAAGQRPPALSPHTALRIMTGAPLPPGADAVVRFEDTDEEERRATKKDLGQISIHVPVVPSRNVRRAGEDLRQGERVLTRGTPLGAAHLGVLASLGRDTVRVHRRPVVAVLATGDELTPPGGELEPGHIYDINTYTTAALVRGIGGIPKVLGIARDTVDSVAEKMEQARDADLLLTSAGVSKGYYDLVKEVLASYGDLRLWEVRMRPGKPVAFGIIRGRKGSPWRRHVPHLGLPGNPVSSMVVFHILARPAILKMMGHASWESRAVEAILEEPIVNDDGRRVYARAVLTEREGETHARLTGAQGSNILSSMAKATGLAICPEDVPVMPVGAKVRVELLD
ncbi:MAG: molybdopterin molybdotransferase MoeA [Chloroflexi bacterium]|nr:molybdopterin molybdotransferase MoeA [Chloroflexota bacterium]